MLHQKSYSELLQALWEKGSGDAQNCWLEAWENSKGFFESGLDGLRTFLAGVLGAFLWTIVYIWSSVLWASIYTIWHLVVHYTPAVSCLASLYVFTAYTVRAARWMFGGLPSFLIGSFWLFLKTIFRAASSRSSYEKEKAVKGFITYSIEQNPPRNSVLLVTYEDGSHAGYATCVRLYNGEIALLTAAHVVKNAAGGKIASTRNGNKIPLGEFKEVILNLEQDFALLAGPPCWESLLAAKTAELIPADQLGRGKFTIHHFDGSNWLASNGEAVGTDGGFISTLCNTDKGFSGTPLFCGKRIMGVHLGGHHQQNINLAAPIPLVAGLTGPGYKFETTAPQGKIFTDEDLVRLNEAYAQNFSKGAFVPKSGVYWSDLFAEETSTKKPEVATKVAKEEATSSSAPALPVQGNGERGPDRVTTGAHTPSKQSATGVNKDAGKDIIQGVIEVIASRVNMNAVEKEIIRAVSEKALKAPRQTRRGGKRRNNTAATSTTSTPGKYQPPHQRSQGSKSLAPSQGTTAPVKGRTQPGAKSSPAATQSWRIKSGASVGPSLAPKQS